MHTLSNQFRMDGSISRNSTAPFCLATRERPAEYSAGLDIAIARGWLVLHEPGTYLKFTAAGADLFA
jgi:hypothetical protein